MNHEALLSFRCEVFPRFFETMLLILAHQGGWDEFLNFAVPVAAGMLALRLLAKWVTRDRNREQSTKQ
jgi:hypothetical protein